jgi:hypothetical protein
MKVWPKQGRSMKRLRRALAWPTPLAASRRRKQVPGKRYSIHPRAFWGWLDGRIWPLMRRGGYVSLLDK